MLVGMAKTKFKGNPATTSGELPAVGDKLTDFSFVSADLSEVKLSDFDGKRVILNIFPSIDTGVCQNSVRQFNEEAATLEGTAVICVSKDLPFALGRFCGAEGIENVTSASAFRSDVDFGLKLQDDCPLEGLLARAVIVTDENHVVTYTQLVDEIGTEPDYKAAIDAVQ